MSYAINRLRARISNTEPTLTDQSQARDADINVIVGRYLTTGRVPAPTSQPLYGDFTETPEDLRGYIHRARTLDANRRKLPKELRDMPIAELMALTPDQLKAIITPAEKPADKPADKPHKDTPT